MPFIFLWRKAYITHPLQLGGEPLFNIISAIKAEAYRSSSRESFRLKSQIGSFSTKQSSMKSSKPLGDIEEKAIKQN